MPACLKIASAAQWHAVLARLLVDRFEEVFDLGGGVIAVELRDHVEGNAFGADGLAFTDVCAPAKTFCIHSADHREGAAVFFNLTLGKVVHMGDLGGGKEHRRSVGTGGDAGPATDTCGGVHGGVGGLLGDGNGVGIDRAASTGGDKAAGLNDAVERRTIDDEVFNDGKGFGTPGLDGDGLTVFKVAHMELAGGGFFFGTVWDAVDGKGAHPADAFAAIVIKSEGFLAFGDEVLAEEVEHFEEGRILGDFIELIFLEAALIERALLAPYAEL